MEVLFEHGRLYARVRQLTLDVAGHLTLVCRSRNLVTRARADRVHNHDNLYKTWIECTCLEVCKTTDVIVVLAKINV